MRCIYQISLWEFNITLILFEKLSRLKVKGRISIRYFNLHISVFEELGEANPLTIAVIAYAFYYHDYCLILEMIYINKRHRINATSNTYRVFAISLY